MNKKNVIYVELISRILIIMMTLFLILSITIMIMDEELLLFIPTLFFLCNICIACYIKVRMKNLIAEINIEKEKIILTTVRYKKYKYNISDLIKVKKTFFKNGFKFLFVSGISFVSDNRFVKLKFLNNGMDYSDVVCHWFEIE